MNWRDGMKPSLGVGTDGIGEIINMNPPGVGMDGIGAPMALTGSRHGRHWRNH
jgi:hypothetical protein